MIKKSALALFSLIFAVALLTPAKANAQVSVGVVVGRPAYGYVPRAYAYPAPYVAYAPGYDPYYYEPYYYAPPVVVGGWYGGYGYGYRGGHYYGYRGGRGDWGRGGVAWGARGGRGGWSGGRHR